MARAGYSIREIAQHMDRDPSQVSRKMQEHEIQPGVSPAMLAMLARVNFRRRSRIAA